jgi:hypothetical protein
VCRSETLSLALTKATCWPFSVRIVPETLAEELLFLAHDIRGKCRLGPAAMDCGVAGALLSELGLAGRLAVDGIVMVAVDDTPVGDPILDELLKEVAASPRTPLEWVTRLCGSGVTERLLTRMAERGEVELDHHRTLGLFGDTWYPVRDIVGLWDAHERVVHTVTTNSAPDERTLALGALVAAAGLGKIIFATSGDWRELCERMRKMTAGDWAAGAVRQAVAAERRSAPV